MENSLGEVRFRRSNLHQPGAAQGNAARPACVRVDKRREPIFKDRSPIMSASGLDVFDRSLETTHVWLNEICNDLGPDKQVAWKVLSTVLHKLRDRLTINLAAHLGAQLPILVRGVYYDQFEPGHMPSEHRSREDFVREVAEWLSDTRPVDPEEAVRSVFRVLSRHVSEGQINKVRDALPKSLRRLWEEAEDPTLTARREEPLVLTESMEV
jgi:uncharacterized protein (DUF2267 family)